MAEAKVWMSNDKGVQIVTMTEERLPEVLKMFRESYYTDEPAAQGARLQKCPQAIDELEQLTVMTFHDGTSLVALKDGKVVGGAFNKVQHKLKPGEKGFFAEFLEEKCKTETSIQYMKTMMGMDARLDLFEHYGVDKLLEVMFVATSRDCRKQGVAKMLFTASEEVARSRGVPLCSAAVSSIGTQKICLDLEWDQLFTAQTSEFEFQGESYAKYTGEHKTFILVAHKV